jgi:ATP-dependent RNA helicase DeaD
MPLVVHLGIPTQMEPYIHRSGRTGRAGTKGTSLALVDAKESRILLAWTRRGGFTVNWRPVPQPPDIAKTHAAKLAEKIASADSTKPLALAIALLATMEPEVLVSALLGMATSEQFPGHIFPEGTRSKEYKDRPSSGPAKPWSSSGPRPDRPDFKGPSDRPSSPGRPFSSGPRRADDQAHGPRKPFNRES